MAREDFTFLWSSALLESVVKNRVSACPCEASVPAGSYSVGWIHSLLALNDKRPSHGLNVLCSLELRVLRELCIDSGSRMFEKLGGYNEAMSSTE